VTGKPLTFHEKSHTYTKGGVLVPGVTTVLEVLDTYAGVPREALEYASRRGTAIHVATELDDKGTLDEDTVEDEIWPYLLAWRAFRLDSGFSPDGIEERVFHPKQWYAGTYDREGILEGDNAIVEIKTTAKLMPSTGPQLAAYQEARNYRRSDKVRRRWAVQLRDDGDYRLKEYKDAGDRGLFMACLTLHNWKANHV
jgi:hypothetical protein